MKDTEEREESNKPKSPCVMTDPVELSETSSMLIRARGDLTTGDIIVDSGGPSRSG